MFIKQEAYFLKVGLLYQLATDALGREPMFLQRATSKDVCLCGPPGMLRSLLNPHGWNTDMPLYTPVILNNDD